MNTPIYNMTLSTYYGHLGFDSGTCLTKSRDSDQKYTVIRFINGNSTPVGSLETTSPDQGKSLT